MTVDYPQHYVFNWTSNNTVAPNNVQLIPTGVGGYTSYTTATPNATVNVTSSFPPCVYCNHMVEFMATQDIIIGLTERSLERICDIHLTDLYKKIKKGEEPDVVFKFPVARIEDEIKKRVMNKLDGV